MLNLIKEHRWGIILVAVGILAVVGFASAASHFGLFEKQINIENFSGDLTINNPSPGTLGGDEVFGAAFTELQTDIATSTTDFTQLGAVSVWGQSRYGDNPIINANSVTYDYLFSDFTSATSTFVSIQNTTGETIWVDEMAFELTGLPTTTWAMFVGTTTDGFVNWTTQSAIKDPDGAITALVDDVIITDAAIYDATSTVLWMDDTMSTWVPADKGYGAFMSQVPILPGEFITAFASTTGGAADGDDFAGASQLFDGKVYMKYHFWE